MLRTQKDYTDEAKQNSNCVASYVENTIRGQCWVCSFRVRDSDETTLTVEVRPATGRMVQIRGKYNRRATAKELKALRKFQTKVFKNMEKEGLQPEGYAKTAEYPGDFYNIEEDEEEE